MTEFNLSEKKKILWADGSNLEDLLGYPIYEPKDVKEFIKILEETINKENKEDELSPKRLHNILIKLAGKDLVEKEGVK